MKYYTISVFLVILVWIATAESKKSSNICLLPKDSGPCYADIQRWYYLSTIQRCVTFTYGGCQGNANNFKSKRACQRKCCNQFCPAIYKPVCGTNGVTYGNDCLLKIVRCQTNGKIRKKSNGRCHPSFICKLPKVAGFCQALFPRWYYNKHTKRCTRFIYGGCDGNANRFKTKTACQKTCRPSFVCKLPKVVGLCFGEFRRWYFNKKKNRCTRFIYGGCNGNANRFKTKAACQNTCRCHLVKASGPCFGYFPRWYYNDRTNRCTKFTYGGCPGNKNRFITKAACRNTCKS